MSANGNDSVDPRLHASRRTVLIGNDEANRMERPSRVFTSRHVSYTSYPSTINGEDTHRNQSPFVLTISDPDQRAAQISLNSSTPSFLVNTSNAETADVTINEESNNVQFNMIREQRQIVDHIHALINEVNDIRTRRQIRRFTEHPYFIRNNLDTMSSNRIPNRRSVRFSANTHHLIDNSVDRSQTPEQELPEVLEQDIEEHEEYERVYHGVESVSSSLSHTEVDSDNDVGHDGDTDQDDETNYDNNAIGDGERSANLSVSETPNAQNDLINEIPISRAVPILISPISPLSPRTESPIDLLETSPITINNNVNDGMPFRRESEELAPVCNDEHPETYDDLNDQLTRLFECPVCFEHIIPPIYQCLLGHLICNKCVLMCGNCPTCRNPFNPKRNLYMEKVGYLVKFPCRNSLTGCKQQMFIAQKQIHEQECCYRHYQCFFTHCAWKGYYPEMHVHMLNNHSNCILTGSDHAIKIMLLSSNQTYKWFLIAHSELFAVIAHTSVPSRRVKIQVNFIGPAVKAKQFKFTITLTEQKENGGDLSQKLTYERSTLPYSEIYEMSYNSYKKDIFSFAGDVLEPFIMLKRRRLPILLKITPAEL